MRTSREAHGWPGWVAALALSTAACDGRAGGGADGRPANSEAGPGDALPSGNGLAAQYPGDVGLANDPHVLFFDDFESYGTVDDVVPHWTAKYNLVSLTQQSDRVFAGNQAVEFTIPQSAAEVGAGLGKWLSPEQNLVYLRYYSKFDPSFDVIGSSHNGSEVSAHYYVDGNATPGIPSDGYNKYLIAYEDWRGQQSELSPGTQNIYIYFPNQDGPYGAHFWPDGFVNPYELNPYPWGPGFVSRPNFTPELGRWYEYEVMLRANTVGQADGQITCWIDGELIADFPNIEFRYTDALTIDHMSIGLHAGANPNETHKWYDNVVLATEYIGPMAP